MTTIRKEIDAAAFDSDDLTLDVALRVLGIDPDLPAEWATVDRCLTWLRGQHAFRGITFNQYGQVGVWVDGVWVDGHPVAFRGNDTVHGALIAACKAVQEATP